MKPKKKRNKQDATLINNNARKKEISIIEHKLTNLTSLVYDLCAEFHYFKEQVEKVLEKKKRS